MIAAILILCILHLLSGLTLLVVLSRLAKLTTKFDGFIASAEEAFTDVQAESEAGQESVPSDHLVIRLTINENGFVISSQVDAAKVAESLRSLGYRVTQSSAPQGSTKH